MDMTTTKARPVSTGAAPGEMSADPQLNPAPVDLKAAKGVKVRLPTEQDAVHSGPDQGMGLKKTVKKPTAAATAQLAEQARLAAIAKLQLRFPAEDGPLSPLAKAAIDQQLDVFARSLGVASSSDLDFEAKRALLVDLAAHALEPLISTLLPDNAKLKGLSEAEIDERGEHAVALLTELSTRLLEVASPVELVDLMPRSVAIVLGPTNEAEANALFTQVGHVVAQQDLERTLGRVEQAAKEGWKADHADSKLIAQAKKLHDIDPAAANKSLGPVYERANSYLRAAEDARWKAKYAPVLTEVEQVPKSVDLSQAAAVDLSSWKPAAKKELSPAEKQALIDANLQKSEARIAELKKEVLGAPANPSMQSRFQGALLGAAVGDCLGATYEFRSRESIRLAVGLNTELIGGGGFGWKPGEPTDDTQMSLAIARAIAESGGFDQGAIAKHFVGWLDSKPKDMGGLTRKTLRSMKDGMDPKMAGYTAWAFDGFFNAGNGSVMRAGPTSLLTAFQSDEELLRAAVQSSELTHADTRCTWGTAAIAKGVALIMNGEKDVTAKVAAWIGDRSPTVTAALKAVPTLSAEDVRTDGYVVSTVQAAFWALEHTNSFVDGIVFAANHGEDTDTAAATAGILLGAKYGLESVPESWRDKVIGGKEITGLADKILGLAKG